MLCPGCGLDLPASDGPAHAYIGASASCWALYGQLLAREFADPARFAVHQLTVDAYAVQHPGVPERRTKQSVGLHLLTLCLVLERGADPADGPRLHQRFAERPDWAWLDPPRPNGTLTVENVLEAATVAEHHARVRAWAADVWAAWEPHHETVRRWLDAALA